MFQLNLSASPSSNVPAAGEPTELEQRLGLYQVFLKLYEHNRALLDEILQLEGEDGAWRTRAPWHCIQGVVHQGQVHLATNLLGGTTRILYQPQQVWVLGRDHNTAIPITDKRLSRRHAAIQFQPETQAFYLVDLNSTNGSFVNGELVRRRIRLQDGDRVRLGSISFVFFDCRHSQQLPAIDGDLWGQINAARSEGCDSANDIKVMNESVSSSPEIRNHTTLSAPCLRLDLHNQEPHNQPHSLSNLTNALLTTDQQANILDRFLRRSID